MTKSLNAERLATLEEPGSGSGYWFHDARLYADLAAKLFEGEFEPSVFEEHLELEPLDEDITIRDILSNYLDTDATVWEKDTPQEQVAHYLGRYDIPHTDRLSYLICRLSDFPEIDDATYLYDVPGVDVFTRGVLTCFQLVRMCDGTLEWTTAIPKVDDTRTFLAKTGKGFTTMAWTRSDLLPDMAAAYRHHPLMQELYSSLESMGYPPLIPVCRELWARGHDTKLTGSLVQDTVECSRRQSYNIARTVDMLLSRRRLPSIEGLGLRYRVILTRTFRPRAWNSGLLQAYEIVHPTYAGMFAYLEPVGSFGPRGRFPQDNILQTVVTPQFVSYRLDMVQDGQWTFQPWNPRTIPIDGKRELWLQESYPDGDISLQFSERSIAVLGMLWSYRGTPSRENLIFEQMGLPERTAMHHRSQFDDLGLWNTVQYPNLWFTGLDDGVFILVNDGEPDDVTHLADYIPAISPYCEVSLDTDEGSFWSVSRIPRWHADVFQRAVGQHLDERGIEGVMGRTINEECFRMTVPPRLYDLELGIFSDPWL